MTTKIFLVRHGEATHNRNGIFGGAKVDTDLTDAGIETAASIGNKINQFSINKIYSSPLKRSYDTADIISGLAGGVEVVVDKNLREVDIGGFESLTTQQARDKFPIEMKLFESPDLSQWSFPSGEGFDDIEARASKIENLMRSSQDNIVICAHAMLNRVILYKLFPDQPDLWTDMRYPHNRIFEIEVLDDGTMRVGRIDA